MYSLLVIDFNLSSKAVRTLRVDNAVADSGKAPVARLMSPASYATAKRRRLQSVRRQECFINCNYIMGSVAEVERVWSFGQLQMCCKTIVAV